MIAYLNDFAIFASCMVGLFTFYILYEFYERRKAPSRYY